MPATQAAVHTYKRLVYIYAEARPTMAESVHLVSAHLHRSASDREAPGLLKDFREQICHILVRKDFRYIENFASDLFDRNVVCTVTKDFVAAAAATYTSSRGTISSDSEVVVNTLLDRVKLEFEVHPEKLESFLEAVKAVGVLSTIYERMITLTDRDRLEANTVSSAGDKCTAPVEKGQFSPYLKYRLSITSGWPLTQVRTIRGHQYSALISDQSVLCAGPAPPTSECRLYSLLSTLLHAGLIE